MKFIQICFFLLSGFFAQAQFLNQFVDSLQGFVLQPHLAEGRELGLQGSELRGYISRQQRYYIIERYHLPQPPPFFDLKPLATAACTNDDFEDSVSGNITFSNQVSGWTFSDGTVNGNDHCSLLQCCAMSPTSSAIISSAVGYTDNLTAAPFYTIYSVFGNGVNNSSANALNPQINVPMRGNSFVRLGNSTGDYSVSRASKIFTVSANSTLFSYAYIFVNSPGHGCCQGTTFQMSVSSITSNSTLPGGFRKSFGSAGCSINDNFEISLYRESFNNAMYSSISSANAIYNPWTLRYIDLSSYVGEIVRIDFIVGDCTAGGHYGYCYLDAQCSPSPKILCNGTSIDTVCTKQFTLSTDLQMNGLKWQNPNNQIVNGNSIIGSVSGTYTLYIPSGNNYFPNQQTVNIVYKPHQAVINHSVFVLCQGTSVGLQAFSMQTATWSTGQTTPFISVAPEWPTTYTVTGTDLEGCDALGTAEIVVSNCTAINESEIELKIVVFPNPASNQFMVIMPEYSTGCMLEIRDGTGRKVFLQNLHVGKNIILTSELNPGSYFYHILSEHKVLKSGKIGL